eukprot:m.187539 g.187539  ORF g.187539 m.187539 type:complete len:86 (+) comp17114_c0_seq1:963-1220(+)
MTLTSTHGCQAIINFILFFFFIMFPTFQRSNFPSFRASVCPGAYTRTLYITMHGDNGGCTHTLSPVSCTASTRRLNTRSILILIP